jgi:hypothetical protein
MDLAILHHFPGGISLLKSSDVSLFLYSSYTFFILDDAVKKYITTKTITVRPDDKPFIDNKIRNKIRQRNRTHYKDKITNNESKTRSSQFVIFSSSANPSMSAAL